MHPRACHLGGNPLVKRTTQPASPSQPSGQMQVATTDQCAGKESFSREAIPNEIIHERFLAHALGRARPASASWHRWPATTPVRSTQGAKNARETGVPLSWPPAEVPPAYLALQSIAHPRAFPPGKTKHM